MVLTQSGIQLSDTLPTQTITEAKAKDKKSLG